MSNSNGFRCMVELYFVNILYQEETTFVAVASRKVIQLMVVEEMGI